MFQSAAIDVAIGLILMYLVLSLACTVVNEFIATNLDLRAKSLAAGLHVLLDDPVIRNAFYDQGLISGTERALQNSGGLFDHTPNSTVARATNAPTAAAAPVVTAARAAVAVAAAPQAAEPAGAPAVSTQPGKHPSYLSAETFVLALIGSLTGTRLAQSQPVPTFAEVESAVTALPPSRVKSALLASLLAAQGDLETFRKTLATWFDDTMERLSGVYKRNLKLISLCVGITVAVVLNANTFRVGSALWSDAALRGQMVQAAQDTVKQGLPSGGQPAKTPTDVLKAFKDADEKLRPLPIGWHLDAADWQLPNSFGEWGRGVLNGIVVIAGWLVTALALSLGAPFWFDLLTKFINIRGAGPKPKRADAK